MHRTNIKARKNDRLLVNDLYVWSKFLVLAGFILKLC